MITKSRREIKRLFKISEQTIDNYTESGVFKRLDRGKYDFESCVSGYVEMMNKRSEKTETIKDKEMRKLDLDNERKEMENEEKRANLIDRQERDREFFELARMTRDAVLNVIPRITPQVANETDEKKTAIIIETEIKKALNKLADKLEQ